MSPSLRNEIAAAIADETELAARRAIADLDQYGEISPDIARQIRAAGFTAEQILGDWLPPPPSA